jgi:hypothetical protein
VAKKVKATPFAKLALIPIENSAQAWKVFRWPDISVKTRKQMLDIIIGSNEPDRISDLLYQWDHRHSKGLDITDASVFKERLIDGLLESNKKEHYLTQILKELELSDPRREKVINVIRAKPGLCYRAVWSEVFLKDSELIEFVENACTSMSGRQCETLIPDTRLSPALRLQIVKRLTSRKDGDSECIALWALQAGHHFPDQCPPTSEERALLLEVVKRVPSWCNALVKENVGRDSFSKITHEELLSLLPIAVDYASKRPWDADNLLKSKAATLIMDEQRNRLEEVAQKKQSA